MGFRIVQTKPHATVFLYPNAGKAWRKVQTLLRNGATFEPFADPDTPLAPAELQRLAALDGNTDEKTMSALRNSVRKGAFAV